MIKPAPAGIAALLVAGLFATWVSALALGVVVLAVVVAVAVGDDYLHPAGSDDPAADAGVR